MSVSDTLRSTKSAAVFVLAARRPSTIARALRSAASWPLLGMDGLKHTAHLADLGRRHVAEYSPVEVHHATLSASFGQGTLAAPAPLQQEGADLIDDVDALADQPLTDAMQRLQVELIGGLGDHELHRRSLYRLGNRLSVTEVVLLAFGIGSHVPRRHQPRNTSRVGDEAGVPREIVLRPSAILGTDSGRLSWVSYLKLDPYFHNLRAWNFEICTRPLSVVMHEGE